MQSTQVSFFSFIIVIPVADRPQHLTQCLASLHTLCEHFPYEGELSVLVADDSIAPENIAQIIDIVASSCNESLTVSYFGLAEQSILVGNLPPVQQQKLHGILGAYAGESTGHKGASRMRNLAYLKLREMLERQEENTLIHFIDSDQEFKVCVLEEGVREDIFAIDYYRQLNKIFKREAVQVLTGKVVGDPPVSPAVMAGKFIQDVTAFLEHIAAHTPSAACQFHQLQHVDGASASYHDMASLFGFDNTTDRERYACTLTGEHEHRHCFASFCSRLNHFFYGEHPTRSSYYRDTGDLSKTGSARTVYTGNYVLRADMLRFFNPFATLGLRMIGPALGRIIRAEIGEQFVSANLPMLHKRTVAESGVSEFRPGVEQTERLIALAGEFERQFYGDILLFSVEALTADEPLRTELDKQKVAAVVAATASRIREQYSQQHRLIQVALRELQGVFSNRHHWWNQRIDVDVAKQNMDLFIANIEYNFGDSSQSWALICDVAGQQQKLHDITVAIARYPDDCEAWNEAIKRPPSK